MACVTSSLWGKCIIALTEGRKAFFKLFHVWLGTEFSWVYKGPHMWASLGVDRGSEGHACIIELHVLGQDGFKWVTDCILMWHLAQRDQSPVVTGRRLKLYITWTSIFHPQASKWGCSEMNKARRYNSLPTVLVGGYLDSFKYAHLSTKSVLAACWECITSVFGMVSASAHQQRIHQHGGKNVGNFSIGVFGHCKIFQFCLGLPRTVGCHGSCCLRSKVS